MHRTSEEDCKDRQVILSLDGRHVGTLLFGQRLTISIEPGVHRLRANNTLVWRTTEFDAAPGEHVRFLTVNRAPAVTAWLIAVLGAGPIYVTLVREDRASTLPAEER